MASDPVSHLPALEVSFKHSEINHWVSQKECQQVDSQQDDDSAISLSDDLYVIPNRMTFILTDQCELIMAYTISASTQSVGASIYDYVEENGHRYHRFKEGSEHRKFLLLMQN